ncbi:MAG: hypothetical protein PVI43_01565 [Candidatus Bathyarchaeota archaeon]|jgi:hypothetical protein
MENRFYEGQEVEAIYYPDDSEISTNSTHVDKITVVIENGQMAGVPWFAVWKDGKIVSKHNAAHLACVNI